MAATDATDATASWDLVLDSPRDTTARDAPVAAAENDASVRLNDHAWTSSPQHDIHEDTSFADLVAVLENHDKDSDARTMAAAQWLFRHACETANRTALRECGAVDALRAVVDTADDNYACQLVALVAMSLLLDNDNDDNNTQRREARRALLRKPTKDDYARLFDAMDAANAPPQADRVTALETLFCLVEVRPYAPELADFVPRVVYQLRSRRHAKASSAAALAVARLAEFHAALLVDHGAIPLLVDLLVVGDRQQKMRAPEALSMLVNADDDGAIADHVVTAGAIAPLVELVRNGVGEQRAHAATLLGRLAKNGDDRQSAVGDAGAVGPLLALARDGQGEEKCAATFAILCLGAAHNANRQRLAAADVDAVLVDVLCSTTHTHRACAAYAVAGLARGSRASQTAFVKAGVFAPLLAFLRTGTPEEQDASTVAISVLVTKHEANKAAAIAAGVIPRLLEVMEAGPAKAKASAAMALGSVARKSALSKLRLVQAGALAPLVLMLRQGDHDEKREAANALRCLAKNNESYAVEMALLGALEALVANVAASAARGDEDGACAALRALRWLTECQTNQDALLALGIRDALNDAEDMGPTVLHLVTRVWNNLNVRGEGTDGETCRIM